MKHIIQKEKEGFDKGETTDDILRRDKGYNPVDKKEEERCPNDDGSNLPPSHGFSCWLCKEEEWEEEIAKHIASDSVDEFLSILQDWFHPDEKWERIENTANEFLYEAIIRNSKKAIQTAKQNQLKEVREKIEGMIIFRCHDNSKEDLEFKGYNKALSDFLKELE